MRVESKIEHVKLEDLNEYPLINIIIPAWKEGIIFEQCLLELLNLSYPNIKVIVNAGGDEKTIEIIHDNRIGFNFRWMFYTFKFNSNVSNVYREQHNIFYNR